MPMRSFPKEGALRSEAYLGWVRSLPCWFCDEQPTSQAHHWPPKGRGVLDDTKTVPVCAWCHQRCEGIIVAGKGGPIPPDEQTAAADAVMRQFWRQAGKTLRARVLRDIERWSESRIYSVPA